MPAGPNVTFPTEGAQVDSNGFAVTWEPVTTPAGVDIVTYQVIVIQGGRELSMYLPPTATSATIPGEFLEPGAACPYSGHGIQPGDLTRRALHRVPVE